MKFFEQLLTSRQHREIVVRSLFPVEQQPQTLYNFFHDIPVSKIDSKYIVKVFEYLDHLKGFYFGITTIPPSRSNVNMLKYPQQFKKALPAFESYIAFDTEAEVEKFVLYVHTALQEKLATI